MRQKVEEVMLQCVVRCATKIPLKFLVYRGLAWILTVPCFGAKLNLSFHTSLQTLPTSPVSYNFRNITMNLLVSLIWSLRCPCMNRFKIQALGLLPTTTSQEDCTVKVVADYPVGKWYELSLFLHSNWLDYMRHKVSMGTLGVFTLRGACLRRPNIIPDSEVKPSPLRNLISLSGEQEISQINLYRSLLIIIL